MIIVFVFSLVAASFNLYLHHEARSLHIPYRSVFLLFSAKPTAPLFVLLTFDIRDLPKAHPQATPAIYSIVDAESFVIFLFHYL